MTESVYQNIFGCTLGYEYAFPGSQINVSEISNLFCPDLLRCLRHVCRKRNKNRETRYVQIPSADNAEQDTVIQIENDGNDDETKQELESLKLERLKDLKRIETLEEKITALERENAMLKKQNNDIEQRSRQLTIEMSRLTDVKGSFENVNDDQNNSRLTQRFESLNSTKWVMVARQMAKSFRTKTEVEMIYLLTDLMKTGYQKCKEVADVQVCNYLQVNSKEDIPANEDLSDYLQLRRRYAVRTFVKDNVKKNIIKQLEQKQVMKLCSKEKYINIQEKLQNFLEEYIECCWLMTVSNPTMVLDFDVVGKQYAECADHFKEYSSKRPVEDVTQIQGTICEVVWPCVQLEDETAFYMKGEVVVVKKGIKSTEDLINVRP